MALFRLWRKARQRHYDLWHVSGARLVRVAQGFFAITQTCPSCEGRGKIFKTLVIVTVPVKTKRRNITVKVPSGVDEGTQLRFVGEGEAALVAALEVICTSFWV